MDSPDMDSRERLDDLLDRLVGEYSDALAAGRSPARASVLAQVDPTARPGLERVLKRIEAGLAATPAGLGPLVPGTRLGRYELKRELGRGGMALVWLAQDSELRRPVALKILRPGLALEGHHTERFRREALAVAKLRHPGIVQIHDVGEERGLHYLAMEYIEGPTLATVLGAVTRKQFSADELRRAAGAPRMAPPARSFEQAVAWLLAQVASALHAAHEAGLVHRDIKPSNILLRSDGSPVVADFGLALSDGDPALSLTGDTLGTPFYMSPEQARLSQVKVDHRTDVYSLGVTLYEALCGKRPFDGESVLEVFEAIRSQLPRSVRGHEKRISTSADAVVRMAMAHDPEQRYATAEAFHQDLQALLEGHPTRAWKTHGGAWRRLWTELRWMSSGHPYELKSSTTFLGLPLVHIYSGRRNPGQKWRVARGWLAVGDIAFGAVCSGIFSCGLLSFGAFATGLMAWGAVGAGLLLGCGGVAFGGLIAMGGLSVAAFLAFGGMAFGYGAVGGYARGTFVMGGNAKGEHVMDEHSPLGEEEWWKALLSPLTDLFG
jgi:serine/threonine protein kinase